MTQRKYQDVRLTSAQPNSFPMEQSLKLSTDDGELLKELTKYKFLVGKLIYLTVTRTNIVYFIQTLSQYMKEPHKPHWDATLRVIRYVNGTPGQ